MKLLRGTKKIRVRLMVGFAAAFLGMALFGVLSYQLFLAHGAKVFCSSARPTAWSTRCWRPGATKRTTFLYQHEKRL